MYVDGETEEGLLRPICNPHLLSALLVVLACNTVIIFGLGSKSGLNNQMDCVEDNTLTFNQGVTGSRPVRPTKAGRPSLPGSF